jgi:hypothetical protein
MKQHYCSAEKTMIAFEGECNWCGEKEVDEEKDYDVVIDVLQKHRAILWKMTQQNMNAESFNMMDQIRLDQIDQLDKAIIMWTKHNERKN